MNKSMIPRASLILAMLLMAFVFAFTQNGKTSQGKKHKPLRLLIIGDSNTEIGNITMPLKALLDSSFGDFGTGYCTFNINSGGRVPDSLSIKLDSAWTLFDMRNDFTPMPPPYYSPDGLSISSSVKGATVAIQFIGTAIDLYYLQQPAIGIFSVAIDGVKVNEIHVPGTSYTAKKITFQSLPAGVHLMSIRVESGSVSLLGVDAKKINTTEEHRFILHKWGNAWASTLDFVNIDAHVFSTSLKELDPNRVIILLGTNDHNLDHRDPLVMKDNMKLIITRIKEALPKAEIWIISTFTTDGEEAKTILPKYVAISYPEAAAETKVKYWNMNSWFGDYDPQKLPDGGVHVSETYGKKIASELLKRME